MTENRYDVLVAEDEAIIALEIKQLLLRHNYNVVDIVRSGEDLVKASEEKNPDIIVSDISLKGKLDGIDAARIIHETQDIPVIFVTGYGDDSTYHKALTASPSAFLLKPFSERKLINSVRDSIEHNDDNLSSDSSQIS
jgi:CheY-like chemotaxis protein